MLPYPNWQRDRTENPDSGGSNLLGSIWDFGVAGARGGLKSHKIRFDPERSHNDSYNSTVWYSCPTNSSRCLEKQITNERHRVLSASIGRL